MKTQKQVTVSPDSATFEVIGGGKHFGSCACPYCGAAVVCLGPIKGRGLVWAHGECEHSMGAIAGDGSDITVLFSGAA